MEKESRRNEIFILVVIGLVFAIAIVVILLLFSGKKVYKVSFDTQTNTRVDTIEVKKGEPFTLPTVTREGYEFIGWYIGNELVDGNYEITKDTILTAKWEIKTYTITFNSDGGSDVSSIEANYNDKLVLPSSPTKSGYTFESWVDESGIVYKGGESVTKDMTLKATWKAQSSSSGSKTSTFKVTFNSNGGSNVSAITVTCGNNLPVLPTPTRSGYTFVSWVNSNGNVVQSGQKISCNNITLTAKWQRTGGNPVITPTPIPNIPTTAPTHNSVVTPTPAVTPNSQNKERMTISFDSDGGSPVDSITFDCSSGKYPTLPTSTKSGYAFMYWMEKNTKKPVRSGMPITKCENVTVIANWYQIPTAPPVQPTGPVSTPKTGDIYDYGYNDVAEDVMNNFANIIRRSF